MNEEQVLQEPQGNGVLPFVSGSLSDNTNQENKMLYEKLKREHIDDGGKYPDAYAMTELIRQAIISKTYKQYTGGGYEYRTEKKYKTLMLLFGLILVVMLSFKYVWIIQKVILAFCGTLLLNVHL